VGLALQELEARVANLKRDASFVHASFSLRPYVFDVLDWNADKEKIETAKRFAAIKDSEASAIYGPLVVRLVAAFERYLRAFVQEAVIAWSGKAGTFDKLPTSLAERNIALTGKLLAAIENPRDYLNVDPMALVQHLSSCVPGKAGYRLSYEAFAVLVVGTTPDALEAIFRAVKIEEWWDSVAADQVLKTLLSSAKTSDAAKKAKLRLKELSKWRNNWAHGGDEEVTLNYDQLNGACDFVSAFSKSLDTQVKKRISAASL